MTEQFIPELDCYPSDLLPEDALDARDIDDDWLDDLDYCGMGEHDFEPVLLLLDGVIEVMVFECRYCGALDR